MDVDCLFPPDSVTWRVHADGAMLIGGIRALLLQPLHPEAMAGFAVHSRFREESWNRLYRTAEYIGTVTYGSVAEAERAVARVRMVHSKLGLDRPDLLLWVHCALTDSLLDAARRSHMPLSDEEADRYVQEMVRFAELVGAPRADTPATASELDEYFRTIRPQLGITDEARQVVRFIVLPPMPGWVRWGTPAMGSWAAIAMLAAGSLPRWARDMYGWPTLPGHDRATDFWLRGLRSTLMHIPPRLREGPHLKQARVRLGLDPTMSRSATR
jgi:uncharacterized protein (DUF2236 family)